MTIIIKNKETLIIDEFKFKCSVGKKGFTKNKTEGDYKTPVGTFDLGNIFSDESLLETLNNCIPPTFITGIKVIAMIIIPIPPNHWRIALQSKILFGISFKLEIIVEPVVVIPDILSKNAFVNQKFKFEKMKGNEPNIAILNQDKAVRRNACCKVSLFS